VRFSVRGLSRISLRITRNGHRTRTSLTRKRRTLTVRVTTPGRYVVTLHGTEHGRRTTITRRITVC
jgi:hypothetical protein